MDEIEFLAKSMTPDRLDEASAALNVNRKALKSLEMIGDGDTDDVILWEAVCLLERLARDMRSERPPDWR